MNKYIKLVTTATCLIALTGSLSAKISPEQVQQDIQKAKSKDNTHFVDRLEYLGVTLDRKEFYTWGSSVVQSDDGKFHLYACQWSTKHGFMAWNRESLVVHFESDSPIGPWKKKDTVLSARPSGGDKKAWNYQTAHNPEVKRIDGKYVLLYISYPVSGAGNEGKIGMMIANKPGGPWKKVNHDKPVLQKSAVAGKPSYQSKRGTDNPSIVKFKGKYYLFYMFNDGPGDNTSLGVAISNKLTGPYIEQDTPAYPAPEGTKVEDLCVYLAGNSIHAVMCDNFGILNTGGGLYMQMDPERFKKGEVVMRLKSMAWKQRTQMFPTFDFSAGKNVYGGIKYERPKVTIIDNKAAYLYLPSGFNILGDPWTRLHVFKIHPSKAPRKLAKKLLPGSVAKLKKLSLSSTANGATAKSNSVWQNLPQHAANLAIDGNNNTRWASADIKSNLEIELESETTFNTITIREYKNRIQAYKIDTFSNGKWKTIHSGKTLGNDTLKFKPVKAKRIRLVVEETTEPASIWEFETNNE